MKKVMIVDDELDILYGLQLMLDWESLGLQISAQCLDGYEAIELCRRSTPDIIITDIRMSGMNGLMLSKYVAEHYPHTRIIFLSSYSEYEYMQTAIDIKASAYLLKPVDEEKLEKALLKAVEEIDNQSHVTQRYRDMESYHVQASDAVLFAAYAKLISGVQSLQAHEEKTVEESVKIHKPRIIIANEDASQKSLIGETAEDGDSFFKTVSIGIRNRAKLLYSEYREGRAAFVFSTEDKDTFIQDLRSFCERTLPSSYSTITSETVTTSKDVRSIYVTAKKRLQYDIFFGHTGTDYSLQKNVPLQKQEPTNSLAYLKSPLEQAILNNDENKVDGVFCEALASLRGMKEMITEQSARALLQTLENCAADVLEKKCHVPVEMIEEFRFALMLTHNMDTLEGITEYISDQIGNAMEFSCAIKHQEVAEILKPVIRYLHEHFSEAISLESIAKMFHMNPSYLSRIFHRSTGINYAAYVTNLRIEYARKLLAETEKSISDISRECGYNSEPSFYNAFKKADGCAPGEYRRRKK